MKSNLILGTVQFGIKYGINNKQGMPSFEEVEDILNFAYLKGIRLLDTAEAYGDSQNRIGQYHKTNSNKFNIITKFSPLRKDLSENIIERVNDNLKTLEVKYLYSYMFHSFDDYKKYFLEFKDDLIELRNSHKIKKIGVSLNSNDEIIEVLRNSSIDLIQLPYNLLDNKSKREKVFLRAKEKGVEIHTRSTFLQGLFFKDLDTIEGKTIVLKKYLLKLKELVDKNEINNLALNYVCSNVNIDGILLGVDSVSQLKNNISCINDNKFTDIIKNIDSINVKEENLLNPANW
tara:strand:- start:1854 stop:2720 length:867 start_codon:yes stop_codon:yes gene_type:complete